MLFLIPLSGKSIETRTGDFGCITRIVMEFPEKIMFNITKDNSVLQITYPSAYFDSAIENEIKSKNIEDVKSLNEPKNATIFLKFNHPIFFKRYSYVNDKGNYIVMSDVYDIDCQNDKEKLLTMALFQAQKFNINKARKTINKLTDTYPNDSLVNLYLARLYAKNNRFKTATLYLNKIKEHNTDHIITLQADSLSYNIKNNLCSKQEVKPNFLVKNYKPLKTKDLISNVDSTNHVIKKDTLQKIISNEFSDSNKNENTETDSKLKDEQIKEKIHSYELKIIRYKVIITILLIVVSIFSIFLFNSNNKLSKVRNELNQLKHKLEKGIVVDDDIKESIVKKLYNNGWSVESIAEELNTTIEIVNKIVEK